LCRDIEVTLGEENHIGESLERSKSTGTLLDDPYDAVQPFCYGVGQSTSNKGKDSVNMSFNGFDEFPDRLQTTSNKGKDSVNMSFNGFDEFPDRPQTTSKSSAHPTLDKPLCSPGSIVVLKLLKLILQHPCSMDTTIAFA